MYNIIAAILLLVTLAIFVIYTIRGGNTIVGIIILTIVWAIIGRVPFMTVLTDIFQKGPENYGSAVSVVIFGTWFGRVLVETGIAGSIIRKTVEFGGDKLLATSILLIVVSSIIFAGSFGVGTMIAIGVIVLPILFSLGVPKHIGVVAFTMSYGAAMFINAVIFNNLRVVAEGFASAEYNAEYLKFGIPAMIIELLVVVAFLVVKLRKGKVHTWAAVAERMPEKNTPMISFLTPLLPVVLILIGCPTIPAFLASMFYALLTTGKIKSYKGMCDVVQKSLHEGISDIGGVLGFLYTVVMFAPMAEMNAPIFQAVLGDIQFNNLVVLAVVFTIIAPLALFRGPIFPWGAGTAVIAILTSMSTLPTMALFALVTCTTQAMGSSADPTQSWNVWALGYTKVELKQYVKTSIFWCWLATALTMIWMLIVYLPQC